MNEVMIERLKELAKSPCFYDDEDRELGDYAGGNIDDAFCCGQNAGEVLLARQVLTSLGIEWE
jgi:hypothetical protein